ncbi:MAG TPA: YitT family protein [Proteiniphilum sp.]|nr:YitT family protein [Proteiniphilum sp.]HPD86426.1 YitT family protein [Proteiniphilum sp.]HPJ49831.1 YitT family protein [Proteiniphilum sp.]HPR19371.1 YitT family protein [Proteiniphilum sp.]
MAKEVRYLKSFYWKDYLVITVGLMLFAIGFTGFIMPNEIVVGGLGGVGLLMKYAFGLPVFMTFLVGNGLMMVVAWFVLGKGYVFKALYGVVGVTLLMAVAENLITEAIIHTDPLIASIIGAVFSGTGLGLVYTRNASTGGTDILGAIITKYRYISMGRGLLYIDLIIVGSSYLLFQSFEKIIYGLIVVSVMYYTVDLVINGARQSVQFIIFSTRYNEIASHVNSELNRGCTVLEGTGWYSQQPQKVLIILARKTESTSIFRLVKRIDENAFISQSNVVGVYGKGFDQMK